MQIELHGREETVEQYVNRNLDNSGYGVGELEELNYNGRAVRHLLAKLLNKLCDKGVLTLDELQEVVR